MGCAVVNQVSQTAEGLADASAHWRKFGDGVGGGGARAGWRRCEVRAIPPRESAAAQRHSRRDPRDSERKKRQRRAGVMKV